MESITKAELREMSNDRLIERMDNFLDEVHKERNAGLPKTKTSSIEPFGLRVSDIANTSAYLRLNQNGKRKLLKYIFNYLLQFEFAYISVAATNHLYFCAPWYDDNKSWVTPRQRIIYEAIDQWSVISSTVAWEAFMKLLYFIGTSKELKGSRKKSKYKIFAEWLREPENKFTYFALLVYKSMIYDHKIRSNEAHAQTQRYYELLRLDGNKPGERDSLNLINFLINTNSPLLDLCNDKDPVSLWGDNDDFSWSEIYFRGNEKEKLAAIGKIIDSIENGI